MEENSASNDGEAVVDTAATYLEQALPCCCFHYCFVPILPKVPGSPSLHEWHPHVKKKQTPLHFSPISSPEPPLLAKLSTKWK